jgi:hypothetical protein
MDFKKKKHKLLGMYHKINEQTMQNKEGADKLLWNDFEGSYGKKSKNPNPKYK